MMAVPWNAPVHELGITKSLIAVALDAMADSGATGRATLLRVAVGRFTAVVPDSLQFYFSVLSRGTLLEGAELSIESIPLRTRCPACENEGEPEQPSLLCEQCGGLVQVVTGRELQLLSVDVPEAA
jgi:hydrogenase nickel incorporation protein HypA/HybF